MTTPTRTYPRALKGGDRSLKIARMTEADREALVSFVATLSAHDLLFLPRDISHPKVVDAWMRSLATGEMNSLVVYDGTTMVGCSAIAVDALSWSRHVGELRVLVSPSWRGKGLGRALVQECFAQALELGLRKLTAQMTTDQRAAIAVFEDLGFKAEALLAKHVVDRDGGLHDLVLLSHDVDAVAVRNELYGLGDALGG